MHAIAIEIAAREDMRVRWLAEGELKRPVIKDAHRTRIRIQSLSAPTRLRCAGLIDDEVSEIRTGETIEHARRNRRTLRIHEHHELGPIIF